MKMVRVGFIFSCAIFLFWPIQLVAHGSSSKPFAQNVKSSNRQVTVSFSSVVDPSLNIVATPNVQTMTVQLGKPAKLSYRFVNNSGKPVRIQAVHELDPIDTETFFKKAVCFCFEHQRLRAHESKNYPLVFVVSPDLPKETSHISLLYRVIPSPEERKPVASRK